MQPHGTRVKTGAANWRKPLQWNKSAKSAGVQKRVFCASLADVFEEWDGDIVDSGGRTLLIDVLPRWPAERELVRVLCSNNALAVAPVGGPLHHLASALAVMPQTLPSHTSSSLERTQSSLFARASGPAVPLDSSVRVMSAQGEHRECVELARQMHRLADEGVPFDQIAVVLRQPGRYYSHLVEAMDRAGIPAFFCGGDEESSHACVCQSHSDSDGRQPVAICLDDGSGLSFRAGHSIQRSPVCHEGVEINLKRCSSHALTCDIVIGRSR